MCRPSGAGCVLSSFPRSYQTKTTRPGQPLISGVHLNERAFRISERTRISPTQKIANIFYERRPQGEWNHRTEDPSWGDVEAAFVVR